MTGSGLAAWIQREVFAFDVPETAGQRLHFRVVEAWVLASTVVFVWGWALAIRKLPGPVYPLGLARYVDVGFLFRGEAALGTAAALTILAYLGYRRRVRWAYLAALVLFHLQYVARYSLGTIAHGANLTGMSLLALGLAGLTMGLAERQRRFALGAIYVFTGLGYLAAALSKLVASGPAWPAGRHLVLWIRERGVDMLSTHGSWEPNLLQQLVLGSPGVGTVMLGFGLAAELAGVLIVARRFRYYVIPALVIMHLGTSLVMNIDFPVYVGQLVILGAPWATWYDRWMVGRETPAVPAAG